MIKGVIVAESLRDGSELDVSKLRLLAVRRVSPRDTTADQPAVWTLLDFAGEDADAPALAEAIASALGSPGWYVDFHSDHETYVVFPGRVFRYSRGDSAGRAEAAGHARALGVPESQLDWPH